MLADDSDSTRNGRRSVQWGEPERVIAVLRVLIVVSLAILVTFGTPINRTYLLFASLLIGVAFVYAIYVLIANLRGRVLPQDWVTSFDGVMTVMLTAATGGASSLVVAVLPLAIVASVVRQGLGRAIFAALSTGALFAVVVLTVPRPDVALAHRLETGVWWCGCTVAFAVLTGTLRRLLDREHESAVRAKAEALAERSAITEERDLRTRLLEAQRLREDGLRVVLHEFRTPVSSVAALADSLSVPGRFDSQNQEKALRLITAHARHLTDMLDSLADLAVRTGDPRGAARVRRTVLQALAQASVAAAGVPAERSTITVTPLGAVIYCDEHRLRRVMTNLLENADRYSDGRVVDLSVACTAISLKIEVSDRGPGLPEGQSTLVVRKSVSLGEQAGTAGLGLWIVEQLVSAMGGTFVLEPRKGGGLVARVIVPLT